MQPHIQKHIVWEPHTQTEYYTQHTQKARRWRKEDAHRIEVKIERRKRKIQKKKMKKEIVQCATNTRFNCTDNRKVKRRYTESIRNIARAGFNIFRFFSSCSGFFLYFIFFVFVDGFVILQFMFGFVCIDINTQREPNEENSSMRLVQYWKTLVYLVGFRLSLYLTVWFLTRRSLGSPCIPHKFCKYAFCDIHILYEYCVRFIEHITQHIYAVCVLK